MDKTPVPHPAESEDRVTLKPFMGVRPGVYLAVVYSAALLLILFFILVFPGLRKPGSLVVVSTEPSGAAVRVDGAYMGTAPSEIFVPKGRHTLEVVLPGFAAETIEREIPSRLFASALFPRRVPLEATLSAAEPAAAFAAAAAEYAAWTFGGEPNASWQVPLCLSEGAYRYSPALAASPDGAGTAGGILRASARFAATRAALRDIVRAKMLLDNNGLPPSPLTLARSAADIAAFLSDTPSAAAWLADTLPPESAALVISSQWYQKRLANFADITASEVLSPAPGAQTVAAASPPSSQLRVNGLMFTAVGGGTLVQGEPFPHAVKIAPFMLCNTEIPAPAYADFLDANPQWRPEQAQALIGQKLATADYLSGDAGSFAGNTRQMAMGSGGISAVSWFAAQAFCEWLGGKLPPAMAGWEVRLPTEAEWEYAAKSVANWSAAAQIASLRDGCWEWCADFFAPLDSFPATAQAAAAVNSPERSLRGGSWLNQSGSVLPETRASLPPEFCSPLVSFRPIIAPKAAAVE